MVIKKMIFAEAYKRYAPDSFCFVPRVSDMGYTYAEVIRYYFRDGKEMFYHVLGDPDVVVVNGARDWHTDFINAYTWAQLRGS